MVEDDNPFVFEGEVYFLGAFDLGEAFSEREAGQVTHDQTLLPSS